MADRSGEKMVTAIATDTGDFCPSGVLLAQIRKNLTLMATTSQLPKLLVYSAVSSHSPRCADVRPRAGSRPSSVPGGVGGCADGEPFSLTA